jgi:hypothetical protein
MKGLNGAVINFDENLDENNQEEGSDSKGTEKENIDDQ